jgi:Ca2+-binding EF-hand superfamily protein
MKKLTFTAIGALTVALAVPALAATTGMGKGPQGYHHGGMFQKADANGDGAVTLDEAKAQSADMFAKLDLDGTGSLTREEMTEARQKMRVERRKEMAGKRFERMDLNDDGSVTREEMEEAAEKRMKRSGDRDYDKSRRGDGYGHHGKYGKRGDWQRFGRADTDKDGKVSLAEFNAGGEKMFKRFDRDGDGKIELKKDSPFMSRLAAADTNKDGVITKDEAGAFAAERFKAMDSDGDGSLSKAERKAAWSERREERRGAHFKMLDADGNGSVTLAEFQARTEKMFGYMDRNDDGKVERGEGRRGFGKRG